MGLGNTVKSTKQVACCGQKDWIGQICFLNAPGMVSDFTKRQVSCILRLTISANTIKVGDAVKRDTLDRKSFSEFPQEFYFPDPERFPIPQS